MAKKEVMNWDNISEEIPLIIFNDENPYYRIKVKSYEGMNLVEINDKSNIKQYSFICIDLKDDKEKTLNIVSKRLMLELKKLKPLINKEIAIKRSGSGMETLYRVALLEEA